MNNIPIILASDNNYAPYMYVTAYSIIKNANTETCLDFYLLIPDDFESIHKNCFVNLEKEYNNCKFNFVNMKKEFSSKERTIKHISYHAYYRLKAADIIPEKYDKCLYFDCDVIVNTDLLQLFKTALNNNYVAGVKAPGYFFSQEAAEKYCKKIGIPNIYQYINSGVLLLNLEKIRKDNITELWVEEALKNQHPGDQDVINKICFDRILHLPFKFNVMTTRIYEKDELLLKVFSQEEIDEARKTPLIIHYANEEKPWQNPYMPLAKYWWKYANATPYKKFFKQNIKIKKSFYEQIFSVKNRDIHKVITICGIKIKIKSRLLEAKQRELQINNKIESLNKEISNLKHKNNQLKIETINLKADTTCTKNQIMLALKRRTPQPELKSIAVHLVDHCNLRCCGCDHFAPLAQKRFEETDVFEKDIKRFAELSGAKLGTLKLMGGEPLLHPQLTDFMQISRHYLPDTRIEVVTNAILLNLQKESFWNACKEYNIVIVPTKYPLKTNYEKAEKTAESYGVKLEYYGNTNSVLKTSYHIPLDLEGRQDAVNNFLNCFHANNCVFLKQGKLYTCTVAPNINQFNKFFNKDIPLSERDGIDIHKAQNIDDILEFLSKPIPFCRYCNVNGRTFGHPWCVSKKEIEEWT